MLFKLIYWIAQNDDCNLRSYMYKKSENVPREILCR